MEEKIKKFFIFAVVFCFLLAIPSEFALAQGGILGALMAIPINIISILLQVLLLVSNLVVSIAGLILNWVLSPYFTSLPYTYGGIVDVGWPIVRDFVDMFFIIALVIIGLATALRIKEYQAQKALPRLIIIALLINFTPVICGLIIDAQNIFMNFFLEEITGFKLLGNLLATQGTALWQSLIHFLDIRYAATLLGKTIGMIAFDWIAAFDFLMYALLFIMRYIMIWVLVIVSPLAFFSWIFPGSQKYLFKSILGWDEWWRQFIEWSMIGIIGAFFLYLQEQLLIRAPSMISTIPSDLAWGWLTIPVVEFINNLLPYGVALAFSIIGFFITTSTSAMGAGAITSFFKEQGTTIGRAAMFPLQRLGVRGIAGMAGTLEKVGRLTGMGAGAVEKIPVIGKPLAWPVKGMAKGFEAGAVAPLRRYVARARRVDFDEMFKGMETGEMAEQIGTLLSKEDRVSAAAWMAEKGLIDKAGVSEEFKKQMAKEAEDVSEKEGYQKSAADVSESLPRFVSEKFLLKLKATKEDKKKLEGEVDKIVEDISKDKELTVKIRTKVETDLEKRGITEAKVGVAEYQKKLNEAIEQETRDMAAREYLVGGLKAGDVKDIEKKSFSKDVFEAIGVRRGMRKWSSAHMSALINNFKKEVVDDALKGPEGLNAIFKDKTPKEGRDILEKLYEENPRIVHFFAATPAGREWAWEGRKFMPEGLGAFRKGVELKEKLEKASPEIKSFYKEIMAAEEEIRKFGEEIPKFQRLQREAERKGLAAEVKKAKDEIKSLRNQIEEKRDEIARKIEGLRPELRTEWNEIEELRKQ